MAVGARVKLQRNIGDSARMAWWMGCCELLLILSGQMGTILKWKAAHCHNCTSRQSEGEASVPTACHEEGGYHTELCTRHTSDYDPARCQNSMRRGT